MDFSMNDFETYLLEQGLSRNTVLSYLSRAKLFLKNVPIHDINMINIKNYLDGLKEQSWQTQNQSFATIKRLCEYLEIPFNAKNKIRRVEYNGRKMPSAEDVKAIYLSIDSKNEPTKKRDKAIISLLLNTGLRIDEARCLEVGDIDLESRKIFIAKSKNKTTRFTLINDALFTDLKEYMDERETKNINHQMLFVSYNRNHRYHHLVYGSFRGVIKGILKDAGFHHLNPYSFRHAFATNLHRTGLAPELICQLMGNSNRGGALGYYIVPDPISPEDAVKQLSGIAS